VPHTCPTGSTRHMAYGTRHAHTAHKVVLARLGADSMVAEGGGGCLHQGQGRQGRAVQTNTSNSDYSEHKGLLLYVGVLLLCCRRSCTSSNANARTHSSSSSRGLQLHKAQVLPQALHHLLLLLLLLVVVVVIRLRLVV